VSPASTLAPKDKAEDDETAPTRRNASEALRRDRRSASNPLPSVGTVWKVLAVLGILGTIGFGLAWRAADSRATTEDGLAPEVVDMRTAGREFAIALTNFDAGTIDADFDRIVDFATGDFEEEADRFYDEEIRTQLREAQATSRSEIRDIYVQSFSGDTGVVFFTADQTIANNLSPQPITDTLRVELGMVQVDGEWKVRTVEVLDAPAGSQLDASGVADETETGTTAPAGGTDAGSTTTVAGG
jgi:plasmid stabilization system protein ParE